MTAAQRVEMVIATAGVAMTEVTDIIRGIKGITGLK
jgi:hypothetical protein